MQPPQDGCLPPSTRRVIVADAASLLGYYAVESLLFGPLLAKLGPRVSVVAAIWSRPTNTPVAATAPVLKLYERLLAEDPVAKHRLVLSNTQRELGRLDPSTDVVLYTTNTFDPAVLKVLLPKASCVPVLMVTGRGAHRTVASSLTAEHLAGCPVTIVQTVSLGPPTCARLHGGVDGPEPISAVEQLVLGIALGVTRHFKVNASTPCDLVPIDVAVAVVAVAAGPKGVHLPVMAHQRPTTTTVASGQPQQRPVQTPRHVCVGIAPPSAKGLCWGMVAEYTLDYYGRFGTQIAKRMPGDVFHADPTIAFNAHFPDVWNYGLALTTPLEMYRQTVAHRVKSYLTRYPHSTTAERMQGAIAALDASLDDASRAASRRSGTEPVDASGYHMLLRSLSLNPEDAPIHRALNIVAVQWERYVKLLALRGLQFIARSLMGHTEALHLPPPTPTYHNEFVFQGEGRAPEPNLVLRRIFDDLHLVLRGGQQPNGLPRPMAPGGTDRTFHAILAQPHVQRLIAKLANEQYLAREDVESRAMTILRQIGDTQNHQQARTLAFLMRKIFTTVYTRVAISADAQDKLWKAFHTPRTSVVIIPSHRSYMDFIIISYILLVLGLPMPHICAGEDFLRLGPVADYLRGCGAFFMRRSFKGDELYATLFKEYVRSMIRSAQCVEFFPEGTRSRTQRTLGPKVGFMKMVTDAFLEPQQQDLTDVLFVPVSLSYEKILEGNLYADELLGIPKPKETFSNLLKSATVLRQKFGSFNVNVGEPISLAAFSKDPGQVPAGFSRKPTASAAPSSAPPRPSSPLSKSASVPITPNHLLQRLAWRCIFDLQKGLTVTPTSLASAVLLHVFDHTVLKQEGAPMAAVASRIEWLRAKVLAAGGHMNHEYAAFDGMSLLNYAVTHLSPHVSISPISSRVFLNKASIASYMVLTLYTNQLVHLFAHDGTMCLAATSLNVVDATTPRGGEQPPTFIDNGPSSQGSEAGGPLAASNASASGEDDPVPASARFQVARTALYKATQDVRRWMWLELPDFQAPSPVDPVQAMDTAVARLRQERSLFTPSDVAGTTSSSAITCCPNSYYSFTAQLVYPYIESYYVVFIALTVLQDGTGQRMGVERMPEMVLLNLAHKLALDLYDGKLVQYVQCCNKESLKNGLAKAFEMKVAQMAKGSRTTTVSLHPSVLPHAGDGAGAASPPSSSPLHAALHELNVLRNKPSSATAIHKAIQVAKEMYAGMHKLPAKL